jgi:mannose-6-phosphate isomerase-like protein (cupin superfamily)
MHEGSREGCGLHESKRQGGRALVLHRGAGIERRTPEPYARQVVLMVSPLLQEYEGDFAVGETEVPPGVSGSVHSHRDSVEVWLISEGLGLAIVDGVEYAVEPGSVVVTPRGKEHQFVNHGEETVRLFFIYWPAGAERSIVDGSFL